MNYKKSILFFLLFSFFFTTAQTDFSPGYFISNGIKTECLIKSQNWTSSPKELIYKLDENAPLKTRNRFNTSEFGLDGFFKFISADVKIDETEKKYSSLGYEREPEFERKKLFLRVIVLGEVKLYKYSSGKKTNRFFYKIGDAEIKPLVYKQYLIKSNPKKIAENNAYKQWLFNNLTCGDQSYKTIENLSYTESDLKDYFIQYNRCIGKEPDFIDKKQKVNLLKYFSFTVKSGVEFRSAEIVNAGGQGLNAELGNNVAFRYSIEVEIILPLLDKQFTIFSDPSYRSTSISASIPKERLTGNLLNAEFNYNSFEIPVGLRYYYYFNEKTQLFLNAAYVFDNVGNDSSVEFSRADGTNLGSFENFESNKSFYFGAGVRAFDRFSGELRIYSAKDFGPNLEYPNIITLVLGFKLI
ncbi:MAG: hypothetical protein R6V36_10860 [Psychroflexus sp.]